MQVDVVETVTQPQRRALYGWSREIFGRGVDRRLSAYPCRPFECFVVGSIEDRPVAALGLVKALVTVDGAAEWVLGFGALVVVPTYQGKGYGATLIAQAKERAGPGGLMAFCEDHRLEYYERRGFRELICPVLIERIDGATVPTPQHTILLRDVVRPFTLIDVQGPRW